MKRAFWICLFVLSTMAVASSAQQSGEDPGLEASKRLSALKTGLRRIPFVQSYAVRRVDGQVEVTVWVDGGVPRVVVADVFKSLDQEALRLFRLNIIIAVSVQPVALATAIGDTTRNDARCFTGTIGPPVEKDGKQGYLTSNHVAAADGIDLCPNGELPKEQYSPSYIQNGCAGGQHIGTLQSAYPLDYAFAARNMVDAAVVTNGGTLDPNSCGVCFTDVARNVREGDEVYLCRNGTHVPANVFSIDAGVRVRYGLCGPTVSFVDQIFIKDTPFAVSGESGGAVYTKPVNGKALLIGLVFAGDGQKNTYVNPIGAVRDKTVSTLVFCH